MGLAADNGVLILQVISGSGAERAGLRGGNEAAYLGNVQIMIGGERCYRKFRSPDTIIVVVAGGTAGRLSAVIPGWVSEELAGSSPVSKLIRLE